LFSVLIVLCKVQWSLLCQRNMYSYIVFLLIYNAYWLCLQLFFLHLSLEDRTFQLHTDCGEFSVYYIQYKVSNSLCFQWMVLAKIRSAYSLTAIILFLADNLDSENSSSQFLYLFVIRVLIFHVWILFLVCVLGTYNTYISSWLLLFIFFFLSSELISRVNFVFPFFSTACSAFIYSELYLDIHAMVSVILRGTQVQNC
jgi:hypothetical protein